MYRNSFLLGILSLFYDRSPMEKVNNASLFTIISTCSFIKVPPFKSHVSSPQTTTEHGFLTRVFQ